MELHHTVDETTEREHARLGLGLVLVATEQLASSRPPGCCSQRDNPRIRRLVADDGALTFESSYTGDLFIDLRNSFDALYAESVPNG